MGIVYQANKGLIKSYAEETLAIADAVIEPGKKESQVRLAALTESEAKALLLKLDTLAPEKANPLIATMVAEEAANILTAVRMVKAEVSGGEFLGILGAGANLDITWLRAKHVGGSLLNSAGAANKGLYGGTSGAVRTWLHTFTAGTAEYIIPEQKMVEDAAVIHIGAIDPIEVPKVDAVRFVLAGMPTPAQATPFNIRLTFGTDSLPTVRFEKPVIVGPERTQAVEVFPNISGDSKFQLLSLLIAKAEALTL